MKKNPYTKNNNNKMLPSFVLYADVLGFSSMAKQALNSGEGNELLSRIKSAFNQAYNRVRNYSENRFDDYANYEIKIFTDNIVIGIPSLIYTQDFAEGEFGFISMVFSEFQAYLASNGFFVRGGIAFGNHYMDNDIVFGNALVDAVSMDKCGGPPKISFTPSAIKIIKKQLFAYGGDIKNAPHYLSLLEDSDGTIFLNYLDDAFYEFPESSINFDMIEGHKLAIIEGLNTNKSIPDIKAKYEWVARYHNFICKEYYNRYNSLSLNEDYSEETLATIEEACQLANYLIDIESFSVSPARIKTFGLTKE